MYLNAARLTGKFAAPGGDLIVGKKCFSKRDMIEHLDSPEHPFWLDIRVQYAQMLRERLGRDGMAALVDKVADLGWSNLDWACGFERAVYACVMNIDVYGAMLLDVNECPATVTELIGG